MKIEKRGIRITDLPGGLVIDSGDGAIQVSAIENGLTLYPAEVRQIRDALNIVLGEDNREGPWTRIEDVPADVRTVIDREGDLLSRDRWEAWSENERLRYEANYAPFSRRG